MGKSLKKVLKLFNSLHGKLIQNRPHLHHDYIAKGFRKSVVFFCINLNPLCDDRSRANSNQEVGLEMIDQFKSKNSAVPGH